METCNECGKQFDTKLDLVVHTTNDHNKILKESTPKPPKEKIVNPVNINELDRKRTELEILKIEREMDRLTAPPEPDTKMDLWYKMLEQQQQHFNQLLEMNKQHNELKLEIERLKIGGESDDNTLMWLEMLKPFMPVIASKMANTSAVNSVSPDTNTASTSNVTRDTNAETEQERYTRAIKDGTITEEMAWNDFKTAFPNDTSMTRKEFNKRFKEIKGNTPAKSLNN